MLYGSHRQSWGGSSSFAWLRRGFESQWWSRFVVKHSQYQIIVLSSSFTLFSPGERAESCVHAKTSTRLSKGCLVVQRIAGAYGHMSFWAALRLTCKITMPSFQTIWCFLRWNIHHSVRLQLVMHWILSLRHQRLWSYLSSFTLGDLNGLGM